MRTTIRLDDQLLAEAKQLALRTGRTLTTVIEDAVRETLARQHQATARPPVRLTTVLGNGILPGVGLDDSAALLDLMDSFESSSRNSSMVKPASRMLLAVAKDGRSRTGGQ